MSKYIIINLNQTVSRFQQEELKLEKQRWIVFGVILFLFLSISIWFSIINYNANSLITERKLTIDNINKEINSLKKEGQINLSKKDIESLYKLEGERIFWTDKLQVLANITPINMAITELEFDKKKFNISAVTRLSDDLKEFDVVENFIQLLEQNEEFSNDFTSIKFISSERIRSRGSESFTFKVEAKLKSKKKRSKKVRKK